MKSLLQTMYRMDHIGMKIQRHYSSVNGDYDLLQDLLRDEFGWSDGQIYMATEHLYRPDNDFN